MYESSRNERKHTCVLWWMFSGNRNLFLANNSFSVKHTLLILAVEKMKVCNEGKYVTISTSVKKKMQTADLHTKRLRKRVMTSYWTITWIRDVSRHFLPTEDHLARFNFNYRWDATFSDKVTSFSLSWVYVFRHDRV